MKMLNETRKILGDDKILVSATCVRVPVLRLCVLLGLLNNTGTIAACEVDVYNAVVMAALSFASGRPATVLDWNNNYGEEDDKCILFHCGPVARELMTDRGHISDHLILANSVGPNNSFGCVVGRIAPTDLTFGSMMNCIRGRAVFGAKPSA